MDVTSRRIIVLGGTGKTGRLVIADAINRGIMVTALVRDGSRLDVGAGLTVVEGNPRKLEDLELAVKAAKEPFAAIVSTLGQTRVSGNPWSAPTSPPGFIAEAISNCMTVAREADIPKLIVMSMWGAGDSYASLNFLMRFVMNHSNMSQTLEDHNLVDKILKEGDVNFVLVRPAMLKDSANGPVKELGDAGEKAPFMPSISSQEVAKFLLDAVESNVWDGRTPVIAA